MRSNKSGNDARLDRVQIILSSMFAAGIALALFLWEGRKGFNMADEGFLWYGVQRVMTGEMPIRDFCAYDPGRYYWSAALMSLWGDNGIIALRATAAVFQAMGLFAALTLWRRGMGKSGRLLLLPAAIALAVWMSVWYRSFDYSLPIFLVAALSFLIERPSSGRFFLAGVTVGLAAVFGRNHGVYGAAGSLGVMAYLALKREGGPGAVQAFWIWAAGVVIGYLPVLSLLAAASGFASPFAAGIRSVLANKVTNIPLPIPWPSRVPLKGVPPAEAARGVLMGSFFIAILAFGVFGLAWAIGRRLKKRPVSPVLAACAFLSLPYAHYAYSRADAEHLALGIFPFLLGGFAVLADSPARIKWPLASLLCGASLMVALPMHSGWQCRAGRPYVETAVAGDKLAIPASMADHLALLNKLIGRYAPGGRGFLAAPLWPGAYAAFGRKSPMWDSYPLFRPGDVVSQQAEIERIRAANPGFAVILDVTIDNRDDLRFHNLYPLIDQYIRDHFEPLTGYTQDPIYQVYRSKS